MIGSEKQIAWANDIKAKIEAEAANYLGKKEAADKMIAFLLSIEYAAFWIENRDDDFRYLFTKLYKNGLMIKGSEFSDCAKCDEDGNIIYGKKGIDGIFVAN
jgi:hypothetical protein